MAANGLSIEMLPAGHGQALWIEWGAPHHRHRMLIDAGPAAAADEVQRRIAQLDAGERLFELFIVTHIELDHIGGAIELLQDGSLGVRFKDVWCNGSRHLSDVPPARGALPGELVGTLLSDAGLPWNQAFRGGPVRVEAHRSLPRVLLEGGLTVVVLSPTRDALLALRGEWDRRAAEEAGEVTGEGGGVLGVDRSEADGSSIAVILEYQDERWLLAAGAHAGVLLAGLTRYGREVGEQRVRLDGLALAHHGSARDITGELLAAVECRHVLGSTNGEAVAARQVTGREIAATLPAWARASPPPDTAAPRIVGPALAVRVFHGSLERAAHPVMVGHYQATPLSGAEGFVNRRYEGRLQDRLATDRYPGAIGESLSIGAPRRKHPQSGVLVLGLGEYGDLTPGLLVETVRAALVRYAMDQADHTDASTTIELGISSVLLGATGGQGLSISASVRAVVDGVCEANRDLRLRDGDPRALFTELQLWERNAPEAELAFLSFEQRRAGGRGEARAGRGAAPEFTPPAKLETADGSLTESLPEDGHEAAWWRVRVCECSHRTVTDTAAPAAAELELEFTVGGRLARTGTVIHRVERRRLERILRDSVADPAPASGLHTTLFELLFPNQLKWDLMAAQDIQLEVDDVTADIPWEMLAARNPDQGTRGQLALRACLIRQIKLPELRTVRRSTKPAALVIGNPPTGALAPSLPGAAAEAEAVAGTLLGGGYDVTALCFDGERAAAATTSRIETALFADDYRIIHIAAHGLFQPDDPTRTGVAIGPDDFLTASMFRQLNVIPDVVFLNCCHLGTVAFGVEVGATEFTRRNLNRLGASLARQLIDCGVRAVVVAGWAVDDAAAKEFAISFYRSMLAGQPFGKAVHRAREAAWDEAPGHSTWGAYQCYGDGGYSLPQVGDQYRQAAEVQPPRTQREAVRMLDKLVNRVMSVGIAESAGDDRKGTRAELHVIEAAAKQQGWTAKSGQLCESLAEGWKAVGDFDKAIKWYETAMVASDGKVTLTGVEQLANLRDRRAAALMRSRTAAASSRRRARELIAQSLRAIELLEELSGSGERLALRGGHYKRRAIGAEGHERVAALEAATNAYRAAYDRDRQAYTLLNYVQLEDLRSRISGAPSQVGMLAGDLQQVLSASDVHDYWSAVGRADARLTRALLDDSLDGSHAELVELYAAAFDSRSTWSQRSSTLDHLLDLAALHPDERQSKALRSLHRALTALT